MIPKGPRSGKRELSCREPLVSQMELLENTRKTLAEFYDLLEEYAPSWYPERLRNKARSVLRMRSE